MKALWESDEFRAELPGWALRGGLCAAVSFVWALLMGYNSPFEIAGMVVGVAAWVVLFAGYCAWPGRTVRRGGPSIGRALKVAAWIKFGTSAAGGLVYLLHAIGPRSAIMDFGVVGLMPDWLLGFAAVSVVAAISGLPMGALEGADSLGWTALITFVDGALFLLVIGVLASAVLLWWRFAPALLANLKLSPAPRAG